MSDDLEIPSATDAVGNYVGGEETGPDAPDLSQVSNNSARPETPGLDESREFLEAEQKARAGENGEEPANAGDEKAEIAEDAETRTGEEPDAEPADAEAAGEGKTEAEGEVREFDLSEIGELRIELKDASGEVVETNMNQLKDAYLSQEASRAFLAESGNSDRFAAPDKGREVFEDVGIKTTLDAFDARGNELAPLRNKLDKNARALTQLNARNAEMLESGIGLEDPDRAAVVEEILKGQRYHAKNFPDYQKSMEALHQEREKFGAESTNRAFVAYFPQWKAIQDPESRGREITKSVDILARHIGIEKETLAQAAFNDPGIAHLVNMAIIGVQGKALPKSNAPATKGPSRVRLKNTQTPKINNAGPKDAVLGPGWAGKSFAERFAEAKRRDELDGIH